jgi:hypothetical protein
MTHTKNTTGYARNPQFLVMEALGYTLRDDGFWVLPPNVPIGLVRSAGALVKD